MEYIFKVGNFNTFKAVLQDIILNLHKSEHINLEEIEDNAVISAKEELRRLVVSKNFDLNAVKEVIQSKNFDENKVEYFMSQITKYKGTILNNLIIHHNSSHGDTVVDYNWALKLVLGSSELKILKYPVFQIALTSVNNSGIPKQKVFDFNKEMLRKMIDVLESVE